MPRVMVRLYNVIPGRSIEDTLECQVPVTLERLEREIIKRHRAELPGEYLNEDGLFNHRLIISGDAKGNRLDYRHPDIDGGSEVWFMVPMVGG